MTDRYMILYRKMRELSDVCSQLCADMSSTAETLDGLAGQLPGVWEDQTGQEFRSRYDALRTDWVHMEALAEALCRELRKMAEVYAPSPPRPIWEEFM